MAKAVAQAGRAGERHPVKAVLAQQDADRGEHHPAIAGRGGGEVADFHDAGAAGADMALIRQQSFDRAVEILFQIERPACGRIESASRDQLAVGAVQSDQFGQKVRDAGVELMQIDLSDKGLQSRALMAALG